MKNINICILIFKYLEKDCRNGMMDILQFLENVCIIHDLL